MMKAISVRQPWASLVARGVKLIETRSKPTKFRGRVAIHASLGFGLNEQWAARTAVILPWLDALGVDHTDPPRGVILGSVEIFDCAPTMDLIRDLHVSHQENLMGDFRVGRFGWRVRAPRWLETPIPAKGALSFWNWDGEC